MLDDKKIIILYIDDNLDTAISKYLGEVYNYNQYKIEQKQHNYDQLTDDSQFLIDLVQKEMPNVIVIDSALFQSDKETKHKVNGERFKLILKDINPFIEVIVISQNSTGIPEIIPKYSSQSSKYDENPKTQMEHYDYYLAPKLNSAIDQVVSSIKIMNGYGDITNENAMIQKIYELVAGDSTYASLKDNDYDELINAIKELINKYDGE